MSEFIGYIAGALTTICFVPQVLKIIRDKDAKGVSITTFSVFSCGVALWLIYGIFIKSTPIIIYNGITLPLSLAIIYYAIKYRKNA